MERTIISILILVTGHELRKIVSRIAVDGLVKMIAKQIQVLKITISEHYK